PGADAVGGRRKHQGLHDGRLLDPQNRQRHQDADQQRDRRQLPVVLVHDRAGPRKFRLARSIENAPIGSDAAFEEFPGLINRLDDVVVHADGFGAGDEIAQHRGLFERASVLRNFVTRAEAIGMDYNIVEAIDQPWKFFEGGVGPYWGILDASREPKFSWTGPIVNENYWKLAAIA